MSEPNSYMAVSIPSYESLSVRSESSHPSQAAVRITCEMVKNLECDALDEAVSEKSETSDSLNFLPALGGGSMNASGSSFSFVINELALPDVDEVAEEENSELEAVEDEGGYSPQLMVIYQEGDISSALHFLIDSLHNPFQKSAVVTVLIEERMKQEFTERIQTQMHPLTEEVAGHPNYLGTLENLKDLNVEMIVAPVANVASPLASPILACDCTQEFLGGYPTGVITLHTFRSTLEAVEICHKEAKSVTFSSVSIWNETLVGVYEFVAALKCARFFLNCNQIDVSPIFNAFQAGESSVCLTNGFHYETLSIYEQQKIIVFPVGELIKPQTEEKVEVEDPISYLHA